MNTATLASMMDGATLASVTSVGVQHDGAPVSVPLKMEGMQNLTDIVIAIAAAAAGISEEEIQKGLEAVRLASQEKGPPAAVLDAAACLHEAGTTLASPHAPATATTGKAPIEPGKGQKQR